MTRFLLAHRTTPSSSLTVELQVCPGRSTVHQQRRYLPQTLTLQSHVIHTQAGGPPHLYMSAVVAPGRKLDASEGDRTLERHLDGRLFHTILAVNAGCSWDGAATEVPLNYGRTEQDELYCVYLMRNTVIWEMLSIWIHLRMEFIAVMQSRIFGIITSVFSVTWSSEITLICWFSHYYQCWKLCCLIFFVAETAILFFRILWWSQSSKGQNFCRNFFFCNIINIFTVTFDKFNLLTVTPILSVGLQM